MYAIIRESTDSRLPNSKVEFTRSKRRVREALQERARLTHEDPAAAKNWHHTLTRVFEMPFGWRRPTAKQLKEESDKTMRSAYRRYPEDVLSEVVHRDGEQVSEVP